MFTLIQNGRLNNNTKLISMLGKVPKIYRFHVRIPFKAINEERKEKICTILNEKFFLLVRLKDLLNNIFTEAKFHNHFEQAPPTFALTEVLRGWG